jgi:hypothetical protein
VESEGKAEALAVGVDDRAAVLEPVHVHANAVAALIFEYGSLGNCLAAGSAGSHYGHAAFFRRAIASSHESKSEHCHS